MSAQSSIKSSYVKPNLSTLVDQYTRELIERFLSNNKDKFLTTSDKKMTQFLNWLLFSQPGSTRVPARNSDIVSRLHVLQMLSENGNFDPFLSTSDAVCKISHKKMTHLFRLSSTAPGQITVSYLKHSLKQSKDLRSYIPITSVTHIRLPISNNSLYVGQTQCDTAAEIDMAVRGKFIRSVPV